MNCGRRSASVNEYFLSEPVEFLLASFDFCKRCKRQCFDSAHSFETVAQCLFRQVMQRVAAEEIILWGEGRHMLRRRTHTHTTHAGTYARTVKYQLRNLHHFMPHRPR